MDSFVLGAVTLERRQLEQIWIGTAEHFRNNKKPGLTIAVRGLKAVRNGT